MPATMTLDYAKSLCTPALLRDLPMTQIAEIRQVLIANNALTELQELFSFTDPWLNKTDIDPRNLEPLRSIYENNPAQINQLDSRSTYLLENSERNGFLSHYASGTSDTYVGTASLASLAQDIALLQYDADHNPAHSKVAELADLKSRTAARLNLNAPLETYADLEAAEYLVNNAGLDTVGLVVKAEDLDVQATVLDTENGLPDFNTAGMVDLVNKNSVALNRSFNNITPHDVLTIDPDLKVLWDNVEVARDTTQAGLPDKTKDEYLDSLFQAAQVEVYRENIANDKFSVLSVDAQREYVLGAVRNQLISDIIVARAASGFDDTIREKLGIARPNDAQKTAGSPEQAEYNRLVLEQIKNKLGNETSATALLNDLMNYLNAPSVTADKEKVKIKSCMLLANHADKDVDLEVFTRRLNQKLIDHDKAAKSKKYRHTVVRLANRLHSRVEEKGRKIFGEKAYALAVNMRRYINNHPGKAWELAANLGIAGGSIAMTLGWVSNPAAYAIGGAMVTHYFFKSYLYPTLDQMKRLSATSEEYADANLMKKWKMARAAAKKADKYHNFGRNAAAMSIVTGVAGGLFAGPLGARAGVSFMTAGANMWRTWREANQAKIMYKRTGDPKYLAQLNGAFDDKIANSRGLKKLGWKVWNFATSKKGQKVVATGGFLGASFGAAMHLANANTVTELASHGQPVNQTGLTADGSHNLSTQQIAASEYTRVQTRVDTTKVNQEMMTVSPKSMADTTVINQETTMTGLVIPEDDSLEQLKKLNEIDEQRILDFRAVLDKDVNTQAKMLPSFRNLQDKLNYVNDYDSKHLSTPAGDPLRDVLEKDMQEQLKLLADDPVFKQLKASLPQEDQEIVDALIKSGNYRGVSQFIESGEFQSHEDYLRNMMKEAYESGLAQLKEGGHEITENYQADSAYINAKFEELLADKDTAKIISGLDEKGRNEFADALLTKDPEKINVFLQKYQAGVRLDADGNVLNSVPHSSANEILYGDGHRSGDAEFMKTYTTRTDAAYTRMLDRQAVHSNYNDHFTINGEHRIVTSAEYLKDAQDRVAEDFIKGKPEGMTVKDYVVHRHMLREYIHVDTERDLNGELSRIGVTREQWASFMKGEYTAEISDKIFKSKLGGHAGRVLIDKEVICGEQLNAEQVKIVHRALSLNNHDPKSVFSAGRALYVEAYGVPSVANNNYGLQTHWHYELDCDGKGKWVQHIVGSEKKTVKVPGLMKMQEIPDGPVDIDENLEIIDDVVSKEFAFEQVFTEPKTEAGGYVINRITGKGGSFDMMEKPDHPAYITFDKEGRDRLVTGNEPLPLEKLNQGKTPELVKEAAARNNGIKMNKSFDLDSQKLYLWRNVDGQWVSRKISSDDIILNKGGQAVLAEPVTYSKEQIQEAINKIAEKAKITLEPDKVVATGNGGYAMITDKGLVEATPVKESTLKIKITGLDNKPTNLSQEQQQAIFEKMQQQIREGQNSSEGQNLNSAEQTGKTDNLSGGNGDISKQIAALERTGNVKLNEIEIQVNPDNFLERGMRTVTKEGFFNEIRNTNTGEVIRVEGVDINGNPIPKEVLMSDQAPESYKKFHHLMELREKKRLGTNFKGGYVETSKGDGIAANVTDRRIGQQVNPVIGQALGNAKNRA